MATTAELAVLWHLPVGSGSFGIQASPARTRRPRHDIARTHAHPSHRHNQRRTQGTGGQR